MSLFNVGWARALGLVVLCGLAASAPTTAEAFPVRSRVNLGPSQSSVRPGWLQRLRQSWRQKARTWRANRSGWLRRGRRPGAVKARSGLWRRLRGKRKPRRFIPLRGKRKPRRFIPLRGKRKPRRFIRLRGHGYGRLWGKKVSIHNRDRGKTFRSRSLRDEYRTTVYGAGHSRRSNARRWRYLERLMRQHGVTFKPRTR